MLEKAVDTTRRGGPRTTVQYAKFADYMVILLTLNGPDAGGHAGPVSSECCGWLCG